MINKLVEKIKKLDAPIVVGLDPMLDYVPEHIQKKAYAEFGETLEAHYSGITVEIMKKDVNKANALKMLLNMLELEESETAVIGDSGNDIPMFDAFENSFCMKKAPKQVKSKAKHIVSGVYEIEKFL